MVDEVYLRLRELLDTMPGGFPATESGVEMKILKKLFAPEDAGLALCLTMDPETPAAIARRCGIDESEAADRLASMASRGLIFRLEDGREALYRLEQFSSASTNTSWAAWTVSSASSRRSTYPT